ncbi:MAG: hypothetical protein JXA99_03130 [Candidatus Lokiarchaeota archaeon]|nr:hypothetical protein [Candidatus Lokiarchaeota archaeon]
MSFIEKKYLSKIIKIFDNLSLIEDNILHLIKLKDIKKIDDIAKECSSLNKDMNLILKKYYPEVKNIQDKLKVKSIMNFYYDLLDSLTDLVRKAENFQKIDSEYFNTLIKFIKNKDNLIIDKYKPIATQEFTSFYDKKSRENLEKILEFKLKVNSNEYFTFGSLEEEIKKIATINGVKKILFKAPGKEETILFGWVKSIISFIIDDMQDKKLLKDIIKKIKDYLESKNYHVEVNSNNIFTNAELFLE